MRIAGIGVFSKTAILAQQRTPNKVSRTITGIMHWTLGLPSVGTACGTLRAGIFWLRVFLLPGRESTVAPAPQPAGLVRERKPLGGQLPAESPQKEIMNPYSHLVIASKLETLVNPENKQEYYWGAIAPDVRYLTAMQRQQTHLPSQQIISLFSQYPPLKSFLQGYLIHCLSDEVDLGQIFFQHFPFSVLKSKMSRQRIAVILELFYFEKESVIPTISSAHNEVLSNLGISQELSEKFSKSISRYTTPSSPESRLSELFELLGLENDSRIKKYRNAVIGFQKNWFLKNGLFFGIITGKIGEQIVSAVVTLYKQCSL